MMQLGRMESITGELIQMKSAFMRSTPQCAWMNAEKPLRIPEDAFPKPAGTASLCKPTCSAPTRLLQQGSSSPHLPLRMSPTFPLCVGTATGAGGLSGSGQDRQHRDLPAPGPADAEMNQVAAGRAQTPGRSVRPRL